MRTNSRQPHPQSDSRRASASPRPHTAPAISAAPPVDPRQHYPLSFAEKLTPRQAARRLGVTLSSVYRLIETERLEASKVGGRWVVYARSVEALLDHWKNTNA